MRFATTARKRRSGRGINHLERFTSYCRIPLDLDKLRPEAQLLHLRIVVPGHRSDAAVELLERSPVVVNLIVLPAAARQPRGDVVLCDVAREAASVVLSDLKELGISLDGSIAVETIDIELSRFAQEAERAAPGSPSDAVVWEEVEARTGESSELSGSFLIYMAIAAIIAAVGIFLVNPILIVGAMVVGPEYGPLAGMCVAAVQRRAPLAVRSVLALAIGFPVAITAAFVAALAFKWTGLTPADYSHTSSSISDLISHPSFFSFLVAFCAGIVGVLSLTTSKASILVGVLVSVTTIPAAANIGISAAYADWSTWLGSQAQLAVNLAALVAAGLLTLYVQRLIYRRRLRKHCEATDAARR